MSVLFEGDTSCELCVAELCEKGVAVAGTIEESHEDGGKPGAGGSGARECLQKVMVPPEKVRVRQKWVAMDEDNGFMYTM